MSSVRSGWWAVVSAAAVLSCSDEPAVRFDTGGADSTLAGRQVAYASDDEFAALTENGAVKLGLTRERVYFEVSEGLREQVDSEIASGLEDSDSRIARSIGSAVRRGVRSALSIDIDFAVRDIRDVDYRNGELVFDWVHEGDDRGLRNIEMDDEPITGAFREEDARAFVAAFRRVKHGAPPAAGDSASPAASDSAAGGTGAGGKGEEEGGAGASF